MPAARCNYVVVYDNSPQVFASASLETILKSDPPKNCTEEGRSVLFVSYFPDEKELKVFEVQEEEIQSEKDKIEEKERARAEKAAESKDKDS